MTQQLINGCNLQALQDLGLKVTRVPEHWCPPAGPSVFLLTCAGGLVQREPKRQSITEIKTAAVHCILPPMYPRCARLLIILTAVMCPVCQRQRTEIFPQEIGAASNP